MSDTLSALMGGSTPSKKKGKNLVGEEETETPEKPAWVIKSEEDSGVVYDWDPMKKQWRPNKGTNRGTASSEPIIPGEATAQ